MAMNKKNANYVTDKTDIAKAQKIKTKRNQKIKEVSKQVTWIVLAVLAAALLITGFIFAFRACTKTDEREFLDPTKHNFEVTDIVELEFDGYGKVRIELYGKDAPKTVENFKHMVEHGYYDGKFLTITSSNEYVAFSHSGKNEEEDHDHADEKVIKGEYYDNDFVNKISHVAGVLSMVKTNYSSSPTDFRIMTSDKYAYKDGENESTYDGSYAAFGKVVADDMDIVEKLMADFTGKTDKDNAEEEDEDNAIKSGSIELTAEDIKAGYIDRVYTPKYSGKYIFSSGSKFTDLTIDNGAKETLGTIEKNLVKDTEYKFRVGISKDAKAGDKVTFTIKDEILKESSTTSITVTKTDKDNKKVYNRTFEALVTGEYEITYTNIKDVVVKDKNGNKLEGTKLNLVAGETYYFEIPAEGAAFSGTATSVTAKIVIDGKYFDLGENKDITFTEAEITDKKVTYTFVAGVSGQYSISGTATDKGLIITDLDGKELNIKIPAEKTGDPDIVTKSAKLEAGKTYKLVITTEGLKKDTKYTLTIAEPVIEVGETTVTVSDANIHQGKLSYTFVAELSGKHVFSASTENAKNIRIFENGKEIGNPYAYLEAGKSYTVEVETKGNANFKAGNTCKITVDDPSLVINTNTSTDSTKDVLNNIAITEKDKVQEKLTYVFTATATNSFEFVIPSDMKDYVEFYVNDKKVDKYDFINLKKDDVCKIVINTKTITIPASADSAIESSKKTTIEVVKSSPKIVAIKLIDRVAK